VCIVTGSGAGIGKAIAVKMSAEGARVVLCDIDGSILRKTESEIKDLGGDVQAFQVDVTKRAEVETMINFVRSTWGRIDCMVANAGIIQDGQLAGMEDDKWQRVIDVNLTGVFLCARAAANVMIAQKAGCILATSSAAGLYGNFGQTNYAATKAGIIGMVKTWGKELGRKGIRSIAVCPGLIDTPLLASMPANVLDSLRQRVPLGRFGAVDEVANIFAFLASDEASYINGVAIEVGGGLAG
jgi:3-oxoacyl-[acyl-carrier protein] reductase